MQPDELNSDGLRTLKDILSQQLENIKTKEKSNFTPQSVLKIKSLIHKEEFKELKEILLQECEKVKVRKQFFMDKQEYQTAVEFRLVEKELLNVIHTIETINYRDI